ncbi:ATP-NAD kinase [Piedraia hortae CBS 480.64]|uniref:ATP-NAD kinase n=1 Tax=Piedraia hortae CBS 480.64 TaxID=1314780 RepID=A0A6A7BUM7_9PEZI|nr:ATP-NAD kinase [Piedraia hortae CBS 480.64]
MPLTESRREVSTPVLNSYAPHAATPAGGAPSSPTQPSRPCLLGAPSPRGGTAGEVASRLAWTFTPQPTICLDVKVWSLERRYTMTEAQQMPEADACRSPPGKMVRRFSTGANGLRPPWPQRAVNGAATDGLAVEPARGQAPTLGGACYFHRRFGDAVDITRVLDEIKADDQLSHSRLAHTAASVREVSRHLQRRPLKRAVRNIMIVTKARDNNLVTLTCDLAQWLVTTPRYDQDVGVRVWVDAKLRKSRRFDLDSFDPRLVDMVQFWKPALCLEQPELFDLVITLGGDGTVLFTSWLFQRIVPPIMSFSLGSLGFLTNFNFAHHRDHLDRIMGESGMRISMRMRFTCTVYRAVAGGSSHVEDVTHEILNELVIDRGPSSYVSSLDLYTNETLLTRISADGIILSTPTGSTAYSLSAGGSLVHPDIPAILLTPICPHTLSFRPMVLSDDMALKVVVPATGRDGAYVSFDGKGRVALHHGDEVVVRASPYPFPTVMERPLEWLDSVSRTLRWNTRAVDQKGWTPPSHDPEFDIDFDEDD